MSTLADLQPAEARRRLLLLGTAGANGPDTALRIRARQVGVSASLLRQWHSAYLCGGLDALRPTNWPQLSNAHWLLAQQRYEALGECADAEFVTAQDVEALAARQGWSLPQARRWLSRYRNGGIPALAPSKRNNPAHEPLDLGALSAEDHSELFRRRELLGELAEQEHVPNATMAERAAAVGVSLRTLRDYHTRFRRDGLPGLAPKPRSDKGGHHIISVQMTKLVEGLRLTHRDAPTRYVHELATQQAAATGEPPPSLLQVRTICAQIPAPVRVLADEREAEFRNRYRLTYPIAHDAGRLVWQIDHKAPVHVLVRDLRAPSHRSPFGEVRPYLTLVVDSASRLVMAGLFSYDPPDRFMVAAAIRDAMRTTEQKPFGGVPDEIWVDNGKDLLARHVRELAQGLGITLFPGPPYQPQLRGIVERLHETLDTRLWSTLPGYVGANVVERNPKAKAELSLTELDQRFRAFLAQYHQEVHSATGQTPLAFWQDHATPMPVDERLLDLLLKEAAQRRVLKEGIKYAGEIYWHAELALLVGEDVLVRATPCYAAPEELEVFFAGQWRCTALALNSSRGAAIPRTVVAEAQRKQRAHAQQLITAARQTLEPPPAAPATTPVRRKKQPAPLPTLPPAPDAPPPAPLPTVAATTVRDPDLFDYLIAQRDDQKKAEGAVQ